MRTPGTGQREPLRFFEQHFGVESDDCTPPWPYHTVRGGYASLTSGGTQILAHTLACERTNGPRPPGMQVCHSCIGRRDCFNPRHLRWGTAKENSEDRARQGRTARGEKHGRAKISDAQTDEIRRRYRAGGITQQALADEYGIGQARISAIVKK